MVDVSRASLHLIADSEISCTGITFAPDSQSFMVGWSDDEVPSETSYDVYSKDGQLRASLNDSLDCDPTCCDLSWVFLANNRVAIAQTASFKVWDLSSEQLEATVGHGDTSDLISYIFYWDSAGQIAANPSGTLLAFCPVVAPGCSSLLRVYVYDAGSLQVLACLEPGGEAACLAPGAHGSQSYGMSWSLHGWILAYKPSSSQFLGGSHLQMMPSQAGTAVSQHAVMQTGCNPSHPPVLSPCSSFVLVFEHKGANVEIRDVRTGKLLLSRTVWLSKGARASHDLQYDVALRWSSCGSRVTAKVRAEEKGYKSDRFACERIMVMQLV